MPEIPEVADLAAEYQLLRNGAAGYWLGRDFVQVAGPAADTFLQGQVSQDVLALGVGESAWSWVLQPQGKVEALVRVTRAAADTMVLDTDGGWGEALMARLNRFKLRVKADISILDWRCLAIRGPGAAAAAGEAGGLAVEAGWPGWPGTDLLGADIHWPSGLPAVGAGAFEVARIEAGVPRMGTELTERTIPAETDLVERTVSFTKGCYTGQELVARIDSHRGGHVPKHLRGIVLASTAPAGAEVVVGDKLVGTLTSVARRPVGDSVGLAYIRRDVEPPADARVTWPAGATAARIEQLPLVP